MVFSSAIFIFFFLPLALALFFAVPARFKNGRNLALSIASLIFYVWGEKWNIFLLGASIGLNYGLGEYMGRLMAAGEQKKARRVLILGIVLNLGCLIFFKYATWAIENFFAFWGLFGARPDVALPVISLPLGISFFTFHALSYLIDIWRKTIAPARTFTHFLCYFSMFPHLVAGPIVRYAHVAKDLDSGSVTLDGFYEGLRRFVVGLGKKVLIANGVSSLADAAFALPAAELTLGSVWIGIVAYSLQIYFDFSAYSDMAIGLAAMFGFKFHENFLFPYTSQSIKEFWRRWHISLSSWFRDYLYIPLGGSRGGSVGTYRNLVLVFLLCGLWHGAGWTFIIWGLYHGCFLVLERMGFERLLSLLPRFARHIYVILVFMVGWVFFRADSFSFALDYIAVMFNPFGDFSIAPGVDLTPVAVLAMIIGIIGATSWPTMLYRYLRERAFAVRISALNATSAGAGQLVMGLTELGAGAVILFLCTIDLMAGGYNPFIYFRF